MAHVAAGRFAGKTQKIRLLQDQKIRGVSLAKGDTCDLPREDAVYLSRIGRVEFVAEEVPKAATR